MAIVYPTTPVPDQVVAAAIDTQVKNGSNSLRNMYRNIFKLVYENKNFVDEYDGFDPTGVFIAYDTFGGIGLTSTELEQWLQLSKAVINWIEADGVSDDITPATISF